MKLKREKKKVVVLVTTLTSDGMLLVASEAWKQYLKDAASCHNDRTADSTSTKG